MTDAETIQRLREIVQRTTRLESRMCRIADHFGIRTGSPEKDLRIIASGDQAVHIATDAMDVALSELTAFLTRNGIKGKVAHVYFNDTLVATLPGESK